MPRVYLVDVEGTAGPLTFVREVLFPFARKHLRGFISRHGDREEVRAILSDAAGIQAEETGERPTPAEVPALLERWIDMDRKAPPLKRLQGLIWQEGYASGELRAEVYADVPAAFRRWREAGARVAIYSSGSVPAQQLYFRHSTAGDLTPWLDGYFDLDNAGPKKERASYARIVAALGVPAAEVVFLSDVAAELDAARDAGLATTQVLREGVEPAAGHPQAPDFAAITAQDSAGAV